MDDPDPLSLAREVATVLTNEGLDPLLIGAGALAAHGYPRFTLDTDFAVSVPPTQLKQLLEKLPGDARFEEPDNQDPLGGVITTTRGRSKVQIVNFDNPPAGGFPALVRGAQTRSQRSVIGAKLVTLEDLILFKAYAGGSKSKLDVAELLVRTHPDFDALNRLAKQYGLVKQLHYVLHD